MRLLTSLKRKLIYLIIIILCINLTFRLVFDNFPTLVNFYESNLVASLGRHNENHYSGRKFVVISSTLEYFKDHYMFHLPLTAQSWRRLNFEPIIFVVSKSMNETNKLAQVVLKYLKILNVTVVHIHSVKDYEVIIGMVSRLFCGLLPDNLIKDNEIILTSDTDLFPLSSDYFSLDKTGSIKLWNIDCCDDFKYNNKIYKMYTMLNIGMTKQQWREVMNLENQNDYRLDGESVLKLIRNLFGEDYIKKNNEISRGKQTENPVWYLDQMTISVKIHEYAVEQMRANLTKIKFKGTRLNRNLFFNKNWFNRRQLTYLTDFHSFHADVFDNWSNLREFLDRIFDSSLTSIFEIYYQEYLNIRNQIQLNKE